MRAPDLWVSNSAAARFTAAVLSPLGWAYGATVRYNAAHTKPYRSACKVICVGNLTSGGTGKTPVVAALAALLRERGARGCILSRGYGGKTRGPAWVDPRTDTVREVGDEALLLARKETVIVSVNRAAGARLAETGGADVILMDDGYQNFSLAKDVSFLVVDSDVGFGNGRLLPAGPLRERIGEGLKRADGLILFGTRNVALPPFEGVILRAQISPVDSLALRGRRFVAFAGIGRPEKFFLTLRQLGVELVQTHSFADHHVYSCSELESLSRQALHARAALMTTEKDLVRIPEEQRGGIETLPVRAVFEHPELVSVILNKVAPVSNVSSARVR